MRYWITEYKSGKEREYGVSVESKGKRIDKGIYSTYKEAVEVIHKLRKLEREEKI